jgi:hypothetical protein
VAGAEALSPTAFLFSAGWNTRRPGSVICTATILENTGMRRIYGAFPTISPSSDMAGEGERRGIKLSMADLGRPMISSEGNKFWVRFR